MIFFIDIYSSTLAGSSFIFRTRVLLFGEDVWKPVHSTPLCRSSHTQSAHGVRLAVLGLQTVVLLAVVLVDLGALRSVAHVVLHVLLVLLQEFGVGFFERLHHQREVLDECVATRSAEIFTHDDAHELQLLAVWRHGVCRNDPSALSQGVGDLGILLVML